MRINVICIRLIYICFGILIFSFSACNEHEDKKATDLVSNSEAILQIKKINSKIPDWQQSFNISHDIYKDSIWNQTVNFYLEQKECSKLASDFYNGSLRPSDDSLTVDLLNLAYSKNTKLRPFYRWCLDKTISIQDGALGELTGQPARKYAELYPEEFIEFIENDKTNKRYLRWLNSISYSGFYRNEDFDNPNSVRGAFLMNMKSNCKGCDSKTVTKLEKFAKRSFRLNFD